MRKTLLYIVILGLLGFSVYYFLLRKDTSTPYTVNEAGFTIKDTGAIGKLFIAANNGDAVTLTRTDSGWIVNNKYKALKSTINQLLSILNRQAALYPVTQKAVNNVIKDLATDAIKVEVYDMGGKKMRVFYVGGISVNNIGTNMLMEGAQTPYVVQVTGFNGYLTANYATHLRDWRDRTVFNIPADEIKSVSVKYTLNPVNSFEISKDNNDSIVITADPSIQNGLEGPNMRRAKLYLKYFTDINCEGYLNGLPDMEATLKSAPLQSTIDITGKHGQHWHLDSYWMELNKRSKNMSVSDPNVPDNYDADRLYAVINGGADTVLIQQFAFRNIFHKAFEFFQKDHPGPIPNRNERPKNVIMHKD